MIKFTDILKEITEGKQVGTLYHFTDLFSLLDILKTNTLKASNKHEKEKFPTVSLTRDKLGDIGGVGGTGTKTVRISIDGNKLSNRYKITPYNYYSNYPDYEEPEDEMEEVVQGDIKNIIDYIIEVRINPDAGSIIHPKVIDDLINKYPFIKISDKIRRGKKFFNYSEIALSLSDDVKQYIDDTITKEKIKYSSDFPKYEMIVYFNKKLNTKYDTLTREVEEYIISKFK
jgi:hypothetical protein